MPDCCSIPRDPIIIGGGPNDQTPIHTLIDYTRPWLLLCNLILCTWKISVPSRLTSGISISSPDICITENFSYNSTLCHSSVITPGNI